MNAILWVYMFKVDFLELRANGLRKIHTVDRRQFPITIIRFSGTSTDCKYLRVPPNLTKNSNRYNSKPEVEINFVPTQYFIVLRGLKSAQLNIRKRAPQVWDFKPPKNSNPHILGENFDRAPKITSYERASFPLAMVKF